MKNQKKTLRSSSQVKFMNIKQVNHDLIAYAAENKVTMIDLSESPLKSKRLGNSLPFTCEGLYATDSYLLLN